MSEEQKFQVDLDPTCDDYDLLEPSVSFETKAIKSYKNQINYHPAQFRFNKGKYQQLVNLEKYRFKATEADCVINVLDIGDLVDAPTAALLRLILKRCNETTINPKERVGISDSILEEILSFISEVHGKPYYYKSLRFGIDNLPFIYSVLQKLESENFIIINYSYNEGKEQKGHVALIVREEIEDNVTQLFVYDQQVEGFVKPFTDDYFEGKTGFGFVARSTLKDARYKHGFYGNIYGVGTSHYLTSDTEYKEEKLSEARLFVGDVETGTEQIKPFDQDKYIKILAKIHENCFKQSISGSYKSKDYMKELLSQENQRMCFVLDKEKKIDGIMGFCFIQKLTSDQGQTYFYIHDVCIDSDYRGQNVCTALMKYVTKFYQSADFFVLEVLQTNIGAIKCYEKLQFVSYEEAQQQKIDQTKSQVITTFLYRMSRPTIKCKDTEFHEYINSSKRYFLTPGGEFYKYGM